MLISLELEKKPGPSSELCVWGIRRGVARDEQNQGPSEDPVHGVEGAYFVCTVLRMGRQETDHSFNN